MCQKGKGHKLCGQLLNLSTICFQKICSKSSNFGKIHDFYGLLESCFVGQCCFNTKKMDGNHQESRHVCASRDQMCRFSRMIGFIKVFAKVSSFQVFQETSQGCEKVVGLTKRVYGASGAFFERTFWSEIGSSDDSSVEIC